MLSPRIVSLLPGATDWLRTFGAPVAGCTHLCTAPGARVVTASRQPLGATAPAIDAAVREAVQAGLSLFTLDLGALRALRPDLVVTQTVCGVCAPPLADVRAALAELTGSPTEIVDFAPGTHKQVLDAALDLGRQAGRLEAAMAVVAAQEARLRDLADRVGGRRSTAERPTVACIEWVEPPMTAGHWTPDLVEHAGGRSLLSAAGERSRYTSWDEVAATDPDVLAVAACGRSVEASRADLAACDGWRDLRAVEAGRAVVLDGDRLFNRPGPSLVRSAEVLAYAIWGEPSGVRVETHELASLPASIRLHAGTPA